MSTTPEKQPLPVSSPVTAARIADEAERPSECPDFTGSNCLDADCLLGGCRLPRARPPDPRDAEIERLRGQLADAERRGIERAAEVVQNEHDRMRDSSGFPIDCKRDALFRAVQRVRALAAVPSAGPSRAALSSHLDAIRQAAQACAGWGESHSAECPAAQWRPAHRGPCAGRSLCPAADTAHLMETIRRDS